MPVKLFPVQPMNASLGDHGAHIRTAHNMMGIGGSYRPLPQQALGTGVNLTGKPVNAMHTHRYPTSAGTASYTGDLSNVYAGTKTRLYQVTSTAATDVSRAANYAQTVGDEPCAWSFCSYGKDVIATDYVDEVQFQANASGLFANLITSAFKPQARFAAVARTSLILANLEGSAGAGTGFADEFAWSVFGNAASFDTAGGAGRQRSIMHPGQVTGLVGGDGFRLFKATSITGLQFTGSSVLPWREDEISGSIGTPYGKSIVQTKEGEIAFWGGDGFYKQHGMSPPQRIGLQLGWGLIHHGIAPVEIGYPVPMPLVTYPSGMLTEDAAIHGVRCARTGLVMWFYEGERVISDIGKRDCILWDPASDLWSFGRLTTGIDAVAPIPDLSAAYLLSGIVGMTTDASGGLGGAWFRFSGSETEEAYFIWGAAPLELDGAEEPVTVRVRGVMPFFTWVRDNSHTTPPTEVKVTVEAFDDPYLNTITGAQPRGGSGFVTTNTNEWGWINEPLLGSLIRLELRVSPTDHAIPVLSAIALDYEVV